MRGLSLLFVLHSLFLYATPISVYPEVAKSSPTCANDVKTIAGQKPAARSSSVIWCAKGTLTYIDVQIVNLADGDDIFFLLNSSISSINNQIATKGDRVIPSGAWDFYNQTTGQVLWAQDANNHQITFGVLGEAVKALLDYMVTQTAGYASFTIYDGANEVGMGSVG